MAQIPLAQIPNAPDLSSMSAPQVNNVNLPKVDFGSERSAVASAYAGAKQDPNNAGKVGASVSEVGQGAYKLANTYTDKQQTLEQKQQELNDNAAWAEFSTNYTIQKGELDDSLLQSNPATWTSSYADFRAKNVDPRWSALPVSVQQKHYADYLKLTSEDQVKISHAAFQKNIADSTEKSLTDINLQVESNQFGKALEKLDALHSVNGIGGKEYEAQKSKIQTAQQYNALNEEIVRDPAATQRKLLSAYEKDEILPEYPNLSKEQLKSLSNRAEKVYEVQQDRNYGDISSAVSSGGIKSVVDLEKDPRFAKVADEKSRNALKDSITDKWLYTQEGESFTKVAMNTVKVYPQTDSPAKEAMELRKYVNENVPSIYRDAINKELDSKINEMASNGGRLKPETELIQYGTQRLAVARDGGVFGKFYSDKEVKDDSSGKKAKANIDIMKQVEDVELILRNSGVKTRSEADKVIEEATATGRAKQAAGELGNQKGWFDFFKSRKTEVKRPEVSSSQNSQDGFQPIGDKSWSVTSYGYKGDTTPDANSSAGIGAFTKHLTRDSFGTSYDVEDKLRKAGVKPGDKVDFKLSNGQVVTKIWHDRGATPEQAQRMGLRNYYGRVDLYSPDSPHELAKQGVKVVGFKPYTENGKS